MVTMSAAVAAVRSYIEEHEWKYDFYEEDNVFELRVALDAKLTDFRILIFLNEDDDGSCHTITSFGAADIKADEGCMTQMSEYLHRANYGTTYGCFELDPDDGDIRFRHSVSCRDGVPVAYALEDLISAPFWAFNRYGNGMLAVSMGLQTAKEAAEAAEK